MKKGKRVRISALCLAFLLCIPALSGCGGTSKECTVTFNTCTNLETNTVKERAVRKGETVSKPNVYTLDEEYSNYLVSGWYKDPEYQTEWNFEKDVVTENIVLYAKWEKQYFIRYFTSVDKEPRLGIYVMEGENAPKQDNLIPGYKVEGYYCDAGYTIPYNFTETISHDTDIYLEMSKGLWWDGQSIVDNWTVDKASGEKSTLGSKELEEKNGESYARVDFGYAERADSHITVFPGLDMTGSQILTVKYKNLGHTPGFRIFWTVQYEDGTVSGQDGDDRTYDYGEVKIKSGMSEEDDWETLTVDMGKLSTIHGASQWAGGKILSMFRLDSMYSEGIDEEFVDNVILFKEISFISGEDYKAEDSVKIEADNVFDVIAAANTQKSVKQGLVFPKDREQSTPKLGALQYNKTDCATYFFPYGSKQGLVNYSFSKYGIDMAKNQMIYVRYKNEGYGRRLTLRYHTKDGKTGEKTLQMKTAMKAWGTLEYNMMTEKNWDGVLESLDLVYNQKDTNNVLSVASIYVMAFKATQLPGINFNDDKCAGFETGNDYKIVYDAASEASYIEMKKDEITLNKRANLNTSLYSTLEFAYSVPATGVKEITLGYQISGKWYTEVISNVKRTSGFETVSYEIQKKGTVTNMYIKLNGKGKLSIRFLQFKVDPAYSLDLSDGKYVSDYLNSGWLIKYGISYDSVKGAAFLEGDAAADARVMFYLGASGYMKNVRLDSANKKVSVCYNNPGEARTVTLTVYYAGSSNMTGSGIAGNDVTVSETKSVEATVELKGNMKDGEWAVAEFDFSNLGLFRSDRNATMLSFAPGGDIYVRSLGLQ